MISGTYPGDSIHLSSSASFALTVNNLPPTLNVTGPSSTTTGTSVTLTLSSSASTGATVTQIKVNWGDGTIDPFSGTTTRATHTYTTPGNYNVTITATDSNNLQTVKTVPLSVASPTPTEIPWTLIIIGVIVAIVAVAAVLFLRRRKLGTSAMKPNRPTTNRPQPK